MSHACLKVQKHCLAFSVRERTNIVGRHVSRHSQDHMIMQAGLTQYYITTYSAVKHVEELSTSAKRPDLWPRSVVAFDLNRGKACRYDHMRRSSGPHEHPYKSTGTTPTTERGDLQARYRRGKSRC